MRVQHIRSDGGESVERIGSGCGTARWNIVAVFKNEGISGIKGRGKRPGFDARCRVFGNSKWSPRGWWIGL